ncbi:MAG: MFS transporter [Deltaproteobacteria bacterium]|nr:MFS transporter [Deltaproteobacteria bacterium]
MKQKIFYGWWIVLSCFLISLYVGSTIFYSFTAFFEPIAEEFKWSYAQISLASSLRGLEMGLLAPLVGFLVHRFGSRKLIFCGVIIIGFGMILLSRTQSLLMFYAAFLLISFGAGGCTNVTNMTAVTNWFNKNSGKALGFMSTGFGCSGLIIPLVVFLIDAYGWRNTLIILGVGMWTLGIPLSFIIRDNPEPYGYLPDGVESDPTDKDAGAQEEKTDLPFIKAFRKRSFLFINLTESIRFLVLSSILLHIMPYLTTINISRSTGGLVTASLPLLSILGRFGFGGLGDRYDKRYIMSLAYVCMATGVFLLNFANNQFILALFILLFSSGYGGLAVIRASILREYYGRKLFPRMIGIMLGVSSIGGIIGPTFTGWIYDTYGSYHFIWYAAAGILLLSIVLILNVKPESHP